MLFASNRTGIRPDLQINNNNTTIFLNSIKSSVYKNSLSLATADLDFKVSELKDSSAPLGAVTMIIDEFFMTEYFNKLYPKINDKRDEKIAKFFLNDA